MIFLLVKESEGRVFVMAGVQLLFLIYMINHDKRIYGWKLIQEPSINVHIFTLISYKNIIANNFSNS